MPQIPFPNLAGESISALLDAGDNDAVAKSLIEFLDFFQVNTAYYLDQDLYGVFRNFYTVFYDVFFDKRFEISKKYEDRFVCHSRLISNILAVTGNTTEELLRSIDKRPKNYAKILTLLSPKNSIEFNLKSFFDWNKDLASLWYCIYAGGYFCGLSEERSASNLLKHFKFTDSNLSIHLDADTLYFGCTFIDQHNDRYCKKLINHQIKNAYSKITIRNKPAARSIGFFSNCWRPNHSVFRNYFSYLLELSKEFDITCFTLKGAGNDTQCFNEVIAVNNIDELLAHPKFINNNFQAFYMPDVGMNIESIILANLRIAPIQFCSPGHSVSTYGSNIDYFISGIDVEPSENAQNNYSEKLVLIPGMGVIHNVPGYKKRRPEKSSSPFIINCSWHAQKVTYQSLKVLKQIIDRSSIKIVFRFFLGQSLSSENDYLPFIMNVVRALGHDNVNLCAGLNYDQYMSLMEEGSLSIDSFHFGGCNTVSDSLYLGIPIVTLEGQHWYNRIGPQMLRLVGLHDCIATSVDEYVRITLRMIEDAEYLEAIRQRLVNADLLNTIYSTAQAQHFPRAVRQLIENYAL